MRRRYRIFKPEGSLVFPSATWEEYSGISESGFTPAGVTSVLMMLRDPPTTSLMVLAGGRIAFKYSDVTEVSYLASARKSILSMLFLPKTMPPASLIELTTSASSSGTKWPKVSSPSVVRSPRVR